MLLFGPTLGADNAVIGPTLGPNSVLSAPTLGPNTDFWGLALSGPTLIADTRLIADSRRRGRVFSPIESPTMCGYRAAGPHGYTLCLVSGNMINHDKS